MTVSELTRVKEREYVDRCRYCGRPTWSFRRRCVPCKRAGRRGPGVYSGIRYGVNLQALASIVFWISHVLAASLSVVIISCICLQPAVGTDWTVAVIQIFGGPVVTAGLLYRDIGSLGFNYGSPRIVSLTVVAAAVSCVLCVLSLSKRRCRASRQEPPM